MSRFQQVYGAIVFGMMLGTAVAISLGIVVAAAYIVIRIVGA